MTLPSVRNSSHLELDSVASQSLAFPGVREKSHLRVPTLALPLRMASYPSQMCETPHIWNLKWLLDN